MCLRYAASWQRGQHSTCWCVQGAQEIFQELPHEYVPPNMLQKVAMHGDINKLYACEIRRSDQFERKVGGGYNEAEFQQHPERYISTFAHKYAPYSSVIVNGKTTTHSIKVDLSVYCIVCCMYFYFQMLNVTMTTTFILYCCL